MWGGSMIVDTLWVSLAVLAWLRNEGGGHAGRHADAGLAARAAGSAVTIPTRGRGRRRRPRRGTRIRWLSGPALRLHAALPAGLALAGAATWLEWTRAQEGHAVAWVYTFEWPLFAVLGSFSGGGCCTVDQHARAGFPNPGGAARSRIRNCWPGRPTWAACTRSTHLVAPFPPPISPPTPDPPPPPPPPHRPARRGPGSGKAQPRSPPPPPPSLPFPPLPPSPSPPPLPSPPPPLPPRHTSRAVNSRPRNQREVTEPVSLRVGVLQCRYVVLDK